MFLVFSTTVRFIFRIYTKIHLKWIFAQRLRCRILKKVKRKRFEDYDPEVLERLPYWVREMLKMLDEVEAEKSRVKASASRSSARSAS